MEILQEGHQPAIINCYRIGQSVNRFQFYRGVEFLSYSSTSEAVDINKVLH